MEPKSVLLQLLQAQVSRLDKSGTSLALLSSRNEDNAMGIRTIWRSVRDRLGQRPHNLLAISDLHLGCDLKAGAKSGESKRARSFDAQLSEFIDWHATNKKDGKPWRLLLNGDIVDFVAITLTPGLAEEPGFTVLPEERAWGLAAEEAKCVWKLARVVERHAQVFDALARFLLQGNSIHVIRGNHDAEFRFPAVQEELRRLLAERVGRSGAGRRRVDQQLEFHNWFYLEPGFFYAEHGNAYDRYCVGSDFFPPEANGATPQREMDLPITSKVLRYFANRYSEQVELDDADTWTTLQYLAWVLKAGNPLHIAADYVVMVVRVLSPIVRQSLRLSRAVARAADKAIAKVDDGAPATAMLHAMLGKFSGTEKQAAQLLAFASRPAEQSVFDAMQLFYVDRLVLAVLSLATAYATTAVVHGFWAKGAALTLVGIAFAALNALLGKQRKTDAHPMLLNAARRVAQLFDVRFVAMGHSHRAVDQEVGAGKRYYNLGSWTNARGGEGFPHLVIENGNAELRRWKGVPVAQPAQAPAAEEQRDLAGLAVPA